MVFNIPGSTSLSLLAFVARAFSLVPPPEDVTVSCHNFQTTVYWNYSRPHPKTSFKLNISASDAGSVKVSVTDKHRYDLTSFVWESEKRVSAFQSVTVSAAEGKHESEMVESTSFTFNDLKTASKYCTLDFPPVNLSMEGLDATVRFNNPLHYYETLKTMKLKQADSTPVFSFTIHLNESGQQASYRKCPNKICTYPGRFNNEMEKYCIQLEGKMEGGLSSNYEVLFKRTDWICATVKDTVQDTGSYIIFVVVVLAIFVIGVCVMLLYNAMAKAWKIIPSSLPKALKTPMNSSKYGNVMNIPYESVSTISITEPGLHKSDSSMMMTAEETDRSGSQTFCSMSDPSAPKSIDSAYAEDGLSESSNQHESKETFESEHCSEEDSVETASITLDPDEECSSGYDRPHRLEVDVDMGHGDIVKCYTQRC